MQLAGSAQLDVFLGVKNREAVIKDGISVNFPEILERKKKKHLLITSLKVLIKCIVIETCWIDRCG